MSTIGRAIQAGRVLAGLDQSELAIASNLSQSMISQIERGARTQLDENVKAIKKALAIHGVHVISDKETKHYGAITTRR